MCSALGALPRTLPATVVPERSHPAMNSTLTMAQTLVDGPPNPTCFESTLRERLLRWVGDLLEGQSVRLHDRHRRVTLTRCQHLRRPSGIVAPPPDAEQAADQGAHHVVAEGIGPHGGDDDARGLALPAQLEQRANRGGSFA